jgi:N-acetyl-anhydromuramyl-L-alanine amidase AmpD
MKITQFNLPGSQYIADVNNKTQIYLHHTAGNADPYGVIKFWSTNTERIGTCVVIGGKPRAGANWADGEIIQAFSSKHWAYHLGVKQQVFTRYKVPYTNLDRASIGIEICNWGQLTYKNNQFYTYVNTIVPESEVVEYSTPHKNFKYYHKYTDAQIEAVKDLLLLWNQRYNIPLTYNPDIWDVTTRALRNEPGVYTHNSVRTDKVDVHPQPELVQMLMSL